MSEDRQRSSNRRRRRTGDPAFWRELWNQARLVYHLMRDPDVPFYLKLLPLAAVAYVIFPADLAPDLVPVHGSDRRSDGPAGGRQGVRGDGATACR
jgi:uncharacterized membrane protein YkvA (DUF1232 family)